MNKDAAIFLDSAATLILYVIKEPSGKWVYEGLRKTIPRMLQNILD